jgi:hypothetical protein
LKNIGPIFVLFPVSEEFGLPLEAGLFDRILADDSEQVCSSDNVSDFFPWKFPVRNSAVVRLFVFIFFSPAM